jgi:RNA polymerase sigma factor (sigma-70 family)
MVGRTEMAAGDIELTRAAQAGDVTALGLLLEEHRAGMRAVALGVLGSGPDVDDVVQDAAVVALVRIADLRDPGAVGQWLRMIVRNRCRMLLRDTVPVRPLDALHPADLDPGPEELLDRHAMQDWVWEAVEELPDTLRLPLVLRHFTEGVTAYDRIAQCHAVHRPEQTAGVVLYDSAPVTGPEHGEEVARQVGEFAARHAERPELPAVMAAFASIPAIGDDEAMVAAARGILPAYVADYWADQSRWNRLQRALRATYISGCDAHGGPDLFDDREALATLRLPVLVVVGRHDVVCGVRWAEDLYKLIPGARLLILERSGHFGHLEEPDLFAREVASFVTAGN